MSDPDWASHEVELILFRHCVDSRLSAECYASLKKDLSSSLRGSREWAIQECIKNVEILLLGKEKPNG